MAIGDRVDRGLGALQALLASALGLIEEIASDSLVERALRAFLSFPSTDRESIVRVLERDADWCRISQETYAVTGIRARANPNASLYVHVLDQVADQPIEPEPSVRDINLIRYGVERLASFLPLLVHDGVHEEWRASLREIIRVADADLRALAASLAREVLALLEEADPTTVDPPADSKPAKASAR